MTTAARRFAPLTVRRIARLSLPWIFTGGIIAYLLTKYSLSDIASEMSKGNIWAIPWCALAVAALGLATMSWADWLMLRAVSARALRWRDVVRGKSVSAMFLVLGYSYSGGAYMVWFNRKTGTDARTTIGGLCAVALSDLTAIAALVTITANFGGEHVPHRLRQAMLILGPVLLVGSLAPAMLGPRYLRRWLKDPRLLRTWIAVPRRDYLVNVVLRILNIGQMMVAAWLAAWVFGVQIPFSAAMVFMPMIILVGVTPVNVAGFGAVQSMWLLFEPWASGERILAFQVLWNLATLVSFVLRGLPFMRGVSNDIADGERAAASSGKTHGQVGQVEAE